MSTFERLSKLLLRDFDLRPESLQAEATLESLEIDSLQMIEILFSVEEEFGIAVPSEHNELRARLKTFGDLVAYIDELVEHRPEAAT
jgi:acyl carrier protein